MNNLKRNLAIGLFVLAGITVNAGPMTNAFAAVHSDSHSELDKSANGYCPWWNPYCDEDDDDDKN